MSDKPSVAEFTTVSDNSFMTAVDEAVEAQPASKLEPEPDDELGEDSEADDEESRLEDSEADTDDSEDTGEDSDEEQDDESEDDGEESDEESPEEPVKKYKATLADGTQVEVADDTTVKLKVDGKFQRVPLKDLKDNYNGAIKHDELIRRSAEANKELSERVALAEAETAKVQRLTGAFLEGVTKGDLFEAMGVINEMLPNSDKSVKEQIAELVNGLGNAWDGLANLTPEQIQANADEYQAKAELRRRESKVESAERREQIRVAKARKAELCAEHGLEESDMNEAYKALAARNESLQQKGQNPINFTVEDVATVAVEFQMFDGFKGVADAHEIELKPEDVNYLIDRGKLEERKLGSRLGQKDYVRLLSNYANKELEALSRKVSNGSNRKTTPKRNNKKQTTKEIVRTSQIWDI